ncbi:MAG: delta 1-pyrroline-5-carboxylate reductase [Cirrosporium novae-zelandiae]|nr:MAG: delta 1-pyrroline-5-carboxylate reductase [Cirrosporium novae-zelandiae]
MDNILVTKDNKGSGSLTLTVLGCGTLGTAIFSGIFASLVNLSASTSQNEEPPQIPTRFVACIRPDESPAQIHKTLDKYNIDLTIHQGENLKGITAADVVILACKPQGVTGILSEPGIKDALKGKLLISILAGVPASQIEEILYGDHNTWLSLPSDQKCYIVRVMPNTAAINAESMTVIEQSVPPLPSSMASMCTWIFQRVGKVIHLPSSNLDVSTALCGSGPAFCALMLEALADGAVAMGLPRAEAQLMAAQTMRGAAGMVLAGEHPAIIRDKVSTPGGCTIGGLLVLEEGRARGTIARSIREATVVASQLGQGVKNVNGTRF